MKNFFYLCILILAFTNCKPKEPQVPTVYDFGKVNKEESSYYNKFFDFKIFFNPAWHIDNSLKKNDIIINSLPKNLGGGESLPEGQVAAYRVKTAHLLHVTKYEKLKHKGLNPYILIMADNQTKFSNPEIKTTLEYVKYSKDFIKKLAPNSKSEPIRDVVINGKQFKLLRTIINLGESGKVYQECYSIKKNDFFLNLIFSHQDEKDKYEFNEIIKHIKI